MTVSGRCSPASCQSSPTKITAGPAMACCATQSVRSCRVVATARSVLVRSVLDDHDRRFRICAGRQQVAADDRRIADAHVDRERATLGRQRCPIELRLAVGGGAGHDRELAHLLAQRHRQADARRARMRGRHARDHLDVDVRGLQRRHFLGRAAEDQRIAALEPGHHLAGGGLAHEDAVDLGLRGRCAAGRLADEDALGIAPGVIEDLGVHQPVDRPARRPPACAAGP